MFYFKKFKEFISQHGLLCIKKLKIELSKIENLDTVRHFIRYTEDLEFVKETEENNIIKQIKEVGKLFEKYFRLKNLDNNEEIVKLKNEIKSLLSSLVEDKDIKILMEKI